ncbi:hypothetical protein IWW54_006213, partial [Coemansia sp. RSA 2705]
HLAHGQVHERQRCKQLCRVRVCAAGPGAAGRGGRGAADVRRELHAALAAVAGRHQRGHGGCGRGQLRLRPPLAPAGGRVHGPRGLCRTRRRQRLEQRRWQRRRGRQQRARRADRRRRGRRSGGGGAGRGGAALLQPAPPQRAHAGATADGVWRRRDRPGPPHRQRLQL